MGAVLTPKQDEAGQLLAGPASNIMLRGGSRSGKTFVLIRAIIIRALKAPGGRHAIFRLRRNQVRTAIWQDTLPKVLSLCFAQLSVELNQADLIATLPNGSTIVLAGLDDKERVEKILGTEYSTLYFNEASQIPWKSIETARTRLAQNSGLKLKTYYDCNPPSKLHWSYQLFRAKLKPNTREPLSNPADYAELLMNPVDNLANLPTGYFEILGSLSELQRLRFERGEWASDVENALWNLEQFDAQRADLAHDGVVYDGLPVSMRRVVVAVDPSGTAGNGYGDCVGIIVAGLGTDGRCYVLEDASCRLSPEQWARRAVAAYHKHQADRIIGEANYGGAMVEAVIRTADPRVPYRAVHATRGKIVRAEPVAALYEKGRVSHAGTFPNLEDQLANMTSAGFVGEGSPDRADALVWAVTELGLQPSRGVIVQRR
jgi:predicted phage terminase large subunit-like protein